jgi:hypothetical protein
MWNILHMLLILGMYDITACMASYDQLTNDKDLYGRKLKEQQIFWNLTMRNGVVTYLIALSFMLDFFVAHLISER